MVNSFGLFDDSACYIGPIGDDLGKRAVLAHFVQCGLNRLHKSYVGETETDAVLLAAKVLFENLIGLRLVVDICLLYTSRCV